MAATDPRRLKPRRRYKIRGPETWALIRESYLAGAPARDLAARYDVTEWAIWRRAWKQGWTKQDRAEATPPPALAPVMSPDAVGPEVDPAALRRLALNGLAEALRQSRLTEARNLAQIVASLERIGAGAAGGFTLADILRAIFDRAYQAELMTIDRDADNPPEKHSYWTMRRDEQDRVGHTLAAEKSRCYAEGRADLREELGLTPETDRPDAWAYRGGGLVRVR